MLSNVIQKYYHCERSVGKFVIYPNQERDPTPSKSQ